MNYLTYGDKNNKSIVLIHGMASTASLCFDAILTYLKDYYVVLVEVDGHIPNDEGVQESLADSCTEVEKYISEELNGEIYCLGGFSMGGTMAVEILGRKNIKINKVFLDAAFITKMGAILTKTYTFLFWFFINWIKKGRSVPGFLIESVMGKGNRAVVDMLYYGIEKKTIVTVCHYVYRYSIHETIKEFKGDIMFIYGSNEPYPRKGAKLLKTYIPDLKIKEIENMGHGQFLLSRPMEYSQVLLDFLK